MRFLYDWILKVPLGPQLLDLASQVQLGSHATTRDMIDHLVGLDADGPPLLGSVRSHRLFASLLVPLFGHLGVLGLKELGPQVSESQGSVLVLGPLTLDSDLEPRRGVFELDGGVGGVPVLPACTGPSASGPLQVTLLDLDLHEARFVEAADRQRGGVDPAPLLGGRHPLETVASSLVGGELLDQAGLSAQTEGDEARTLIKDGEVKAPSGQKA